MESKSGYLEIPITRGEELKAGWRGAGEEPEEGPRGRIWLTDPAASTEAGSRTSRQLLPARHGRAGVFGFGAHRVDQSLKPP